MPVLDDRPRLHPIHAELWDAFNVLSAARDVNYVATDSGTHPIPQRIRLTEAIAYAKVAGHDRIEDFLAIIRAMDDVFVNHMTEKAVKKT